MKNICQTMIKAFGTFFFYVVKASTTSLIEKNCMYMYKIKELFYMMHMWHGQPRALYMLYFYVNNPKICLFSPTLACPFEKIENLFITNLDHHLLSDYFARLHKPLKSEHMN